jgi:hypothetical protein
VRLPHSQNRGAAGRENSSSPALGQKRDGRAEHVQRVDLDGASSRATFGACRSVPKAAVAFLGKDGLTLGKSGPYVLFGRSRGDDASAPATVKASFHQAHCAPRRAHPTASSCSVGETRG